MSTTPLHTRLQKVEDHLRELARWSLTPETIADYNSMADAVSEAVADARLTDTALYLPVPFVLKQQREMEDRLKQLEQQLRGAIPAERVIHCGPEAAYGEV